MRGLDGYEVPTAEQSKVSRLKDRMAVAANTAVAKRLGSARFMQQQPQRPWRRQHGAGKLGLRAIGRSHVHPHTGERTSLSGRSLSSQARIEADRRQGLCTDDSDLDDWFASDTDNDAPGLPAPLPGQAPVAGRGSGEGPPRRVAFAPAISYMGSNESQLLADAEDAVRLRAPGPGLALGPRSPPAMRDSLWQPLSLMGQYGQSRLEAGDLAGPPAAGLAPDPATGRPAGGFRLRRPHSLNTVGPDVGQAGAFLGAATLSAGPGAGPAIRFRIVSPDGRLAARYRDVDALATGVLAGDEPPGTVAGQEDTLRTRRELVTPLGITIDDATDTPDGVVVVPVGPAAPASLDGASVAAPPPLQGDTSSVFATPQAGAMLADRFLRFEGLSRPRPRKLLNSASTTTLMAPEVGSRLQRPATRYRVAKPVVPPLAGVPPPAGQADDLARSSSFEDFFPLMDLAEDGEDGRPAGRSRRGRLRGWARRTGQRLGMLVPGRSRGWRSAPGASTGNTPGVHPANMAPRRPGRVRGFRRRAGRLFGFLRKKPTRHRPPVTRPLAASGHWSVSAARRKGHRGYQRSRARWRARRGPPLAPDAGSTPAGTDPGARDATGVGIAAGTAAAPPAAGPSAVAAAPAAPMVRRQSVFHTYDAPQSPRLAPYQTVTPSALAADAAARSAIDTSHPPSDIGSGLATPILRRDSADRKLAAQMDGGSRSACLTRRAFERAASTTRLTALICNPQSARITYALAARWANFILRQCPRCSGDCPAGGMAALQTGSTCHYDLGISTARGARIAGDLAQQRTRSLVVIYECETIGKAPLLRPLAHLLDTIEALGKLEEAQREPSLAGGPAHAARRYSARLVVCARRLPGRICLIGDPHGAGGYATWFHIFGQRYDGRGRRTSSRGADNGQAPHSNGGSNGANNAPESPKRRKRRSPSHSPRPGSPVLVATQPSPFAMLSPERPADWRSLVYSGREGLASSLAPPDGADTLAGPGQREPTSQTGPTRQVAPAGPHSALAHLLSPPALTPAVLLSPHGPAEMAAASLFPGAWPAGRRQPTAAVAVVPPPAAPPPAALTPGLPPLRSQAPNWYLDMAHGALARGTANILDPFPDEALRSPVPNPRPMPAEALDRQQLFPLCRDLVSLRSGTITEETILDFLAPHDGTRLGGTENGGILGAGAPFATAPAPDTTSYFVANRPLAGQFRPAGRAVGIAFQRGPRRPSQATRLDICVAVVTAAPEPQDQMAALDEELFGRRILYALQTCGFPPSCVHALSIPAPSATWKTMAPAPAVAAATAATAVFMADGRD
ncbi:hypothetical protein H696_00509 [Fonticula alba]|uniref:Uncharacterized protein n=1 Tax=Fonticula alba TaxID=691883 RepID=A0A058ZEZ3_FONAL|nr:hypothetical protein H696_00509 [Fonticula alba]KCV72955.1 hypothetical protein H696_00509 [Fonticula alba]|eukprot:XP_009492656.1 hypothetical protein H696_00509 [Fonticula alba]